MSVVPIAAVAGVSALAALAVKRYLASKLAIAGLTDESLKELQCEGRGPFAPARPSSGDLAAGKTEHGRVMCVGPIVLQRAQFNALWIRVGVAGLPTPPASLLRVVVDTAIAAQSAGKKKAAVYLAISDACLESGKGVDMPYLRQQGFAFHHYRPPTKGGADHGEIVHVADLAKMVPSYATSIEGATGVVLSPDEAQVLAVWERGGWNTPGGAVDEGEDKFTALSRECSEEVGVVLDPKFPPVYLGGWQKGRARDGKINDNFSVFAVRAATSTFAVDHKEISHAMWLPWKELLDEWAAAGKPASEKVVPLKHRALPEGKALVSKNLLKWLDMLRAGKGMPCKLDGKGEVKIGA